MAGTLLHITLADTAVAGQSNPDEHINTIITPHIADYHLGAVIFDLPYFDHFYRRALLFYTTRELGYSTWGQLFHLRAPNLFVRLLLEHATCPAAQAFALGALTHIAVDLTFHPFIESTIMEIADGTVDLNRLHKDIEDQLDATVSQTLLGHTGVGTPYAAKMLNISPTFAYTTTLRTICRRIHGAAPSHKQFEHWRKRLKQFGALHRSPRFPWATRDSTHRNNTYYQKGQTLAQEAIQTSIDYLETGLAFMEKHIDAAQFADRVPDRNLINGKEAAAARQWVDAKS